MKPEIKCNDNLEELKKLPDNSVDLVYLDFMKERFMELKRVLKETGNLYVHVDHRIDPEIRVMLKKTFGDHNVLSTIAMVKNAGAKLMAKGWSNVFDSITHVVKSPDYTFHDQYKPYHPNTVKRYNKEDEKGKFYFKPAAARGIAKSKKRRKFEYNGCTDYWIFSEETMEKMEKNGDLVDNGDCKLQWKLRPNPDGVKILNVWDDFKYAPKKTYSTQKPEKLLERIVLSSSNPGDTVLDAFAGSGTTCAVAKKLGRKSICIDENPKACKIMEERLQ